MTRANTAEAKRSATTYSSICFDLVKGGHHGTGIGIGNGSERQWKCLISLEEDQTHAHNKNGDKYLRFICALCSKRV